MENTEDTQDNREVNALQGATEDDSLECWKEMLERRLKIRFHAFNFYICVWFKHLYWQGQI